MKISEHSVFTITHRGTLNVLAEASSLEEVDEKIAAHRGDGDVNLPLRVRRWWREPLRITRTDTVTIETGPHPVRDPGAATADLAALAQEA